MSRQTRKRNRNNQISDDFVAATRNSAAQVEYNNIAPKEVEKFVPKTKNQKLAWDMCKQGRQVIVLSGTWGSGKSMLSAAWAAEQLRNKKIEKVFLVRPNVPTGKSIGAVTGDATQKLSAHLTQILAHMEKFLGKGFMRYCLDKKLIELQPVEFLRGTSFENCVVIVEECQNFTHEEFKMMLTRSGNNSQVLYNGDWRQSDLRNNSGLITTINMFRKLLEEQPYYLTDEDLDNLEYQIGVVEFTVDDIVRSGLAKTLFKVYHYDEL